jgi:hypothetical protein
MGGSGGLPIGGAVPKGKETPSSKTEKCDSIRL